MKTIPWEKVDIEVITVETNHAGEVFEGSRDEIRNFLEEKDYVLVHTIGNMFICAEDNTNHYVVAAIDDVFVRKDLFEGKYSPDMAAWDEFDSLTVKFCGRKNKRSEFANILRQINKNIV